MDSHCDDLGVKMMNNGSAMDWGIKNDGDEGECSVGHNTALHIGFKTVAEENPSNINRK